MELDDWSMAPPTQVGYYWMLDDSFRAVPRLVEIVKAKSYPSPSCRLETYELPPESLVVLEFGDCEPIALSECAFKWWSPPITVDYISPMDLWRGRKHDLHVPRAEVEFNRELVEDLTKEAVSGAS